VSATAGGPVARIALRYVVGRVHRALASVSGIELGESKPSNNALKLTAHRRSAVFCGQWRVPREDRQDES
jgi:hypothetical protein